MNKKVNYYSITILLIANLTSVQAQDVHFSQRLAAQRERNPAFTNQFDGSWQAMSIYRQQWQSIGTPFITGGLFFTKKFDSPIKGLVPFAGITNINDQSGDGKLNVNLFNLNIGLNYTLGRNSISFALSNALVLKNFNQGGLSFPSQFDRNIGLFNRDLPNSENFSGENTEFFDMGFGILYERKLNDDWILHSGFSMQHVNQAEESFFDADNTKNLGYGLQFSADYRFSELINFVPSLSFYRAKGAAETIVGSKVRFNSSKFGPIERISPFLLFRTGFDRLTDALIIGSQASINRFLFGISYDVNISELELASDYQGGFEMLLIYTMPEKKLNFKRIPCERY